MSSPRSIASFTPIASFVFVASTGVAGAQTPTPVPPTQMPAEQTPSSARVAGRVLTLEECVAIALEAQPRIQATLADYAAARYRVNQAFSPLLPQVSGVVSAVRSNIPTVATNAAGTNVTLTQTRQFGDSFLAQVQLSQKIFDFGKTFATTEAARRLAEIAQEDVELQRQGVTFLVKQNFILINFAQRLIRVQEQSLERADLNRPARLLRGRHAAQIRRRPRRGRRGQRQVDLIRARNAERVARVALNTAMGYSGAATQVQDILFYQPVRASPSSCRPRPWQRPEYRQSKLRASAGRGAGAAGLRTSFPTSPGRRLRRCADRAQRGRGRSAWP